MEDQPYCCEVVDTQVYNVESGSTLYLVDVEDLLIEEEITNVRYVSDPVMLSAFEIDLDTPKEDYGWNFVDVLIETKDNMEDIILRFSNTNSVYRHEYIIKSPWLSDTQEL